MPSTDPLSRLLDVLQPSLAMYLSDSGIWSYPGKESIKLALADLVGDHRSLVERVATALEERGVTPSPPAYPISYTGCHDVDIRSLLPRVVAGLRGQTAAFEQILASSGDDTVAVELARESKASTLAHVDVLEQAMKSAS